MGSAGFRDWRRDWPPAKENDMSDDSWKLLNQILVRMAKLSEADLTYLEGRLAEEIAKRKRDDE